VPSTSLKCAQHILRNALKGEEWNIDELCGCCLCPNPGNRRIEKDAVLINYVPQQTNEKQMALTLKRLFKRVYV